MMFRFYLLIIFLLPFLCAVSSNGVDVFKNSTSIQGSSYSLLAVNLVSGDTLLNENANQRLIPASLLKLFTTGTSLDVLGSNYRFRTIFGYRGVIKDGVLNGDLVIQGFGDPTLGSIHFTTTHPDTVLTQIGRGLKDKGIRSIIGNIVLVDDYIDSKEMANGRLIEDVANYYGALPRSLNWRDNSFTLYLNSALTPDVNCEFVRTEPALKDVPFYLNVYSSNLNQDSAYIYPFKDGFVVRGSIPLSKRSFAIKGVMPSPELQFVSELRTYLVNNKIVINPDKTIPLVADTVEVTPIITIESPALIDIIGVTNRKSINLFADALFLTMGKDSDLKWQWSGSSQYLTRFWKQRINSSLWIEDGSGMSPRNLVTSSQLVALLQYEYQLSHYLVFQKSLAIAGVSGTLKGSFFNQKGRFFGKSGSMKGVLCYAGYYLNQKSEAVAVSVMVNNFVCKSSEVKAEIERLFSAELK